MPPEPVPPAAMSCACDTPRGCRSVKRRLVVLYREIPIWERRSSMPAGFHSLREPELTLAKRCQVRRSAAPNKIDVEVVGREIRGCLAREEGSALPGKIRRVLRASNGSANIHDAAVAIAIVRIFNRMHYV